jgi:DDE superfamily endonuclease
MAASPSLGVAPEDVQSWGQDSNRSSDASLAGSPEARSATGSGPISSAYAGRSSARTPGRPPSRSATTAPTASSTPRAAPTGTPPDAVRDDLRAYVVEALGAGDAPLIRAKAGFLEKGTHSAGVARQYSGTAGRIEDRQVGVRLASGSRHGTASPGRALYLPQGWTDDPGRCQEAGVPQGAALATKAQRAEPMLAPAFAAGVPAAWVTGGSGQAIRLFRTFDTAGEFLTPPPRRW